MLPTLGYPRVGSEGGVWLQGTASFGAGLAPTAHRMAQPLTTYMTVATLIKGGHGGLIFSWTAVRVFLYE